MHTVRRLADAVIVHAISFDAVGANLQRRGSGRRVKADEILQPRSSAGSVSIHTRERGVVAKIAELPGVEAVVINAAL